MFLMVFLLFFAGVTGEKSEEIERWVKQAWEKNPEIAVMQAEYEAHLRRIPVAKTLPDPQIGVMLQNESSAFSLGRMPMSMFGFSVSQMFPYPGKLSLMGEMAYWEAQMSYARWQQAKNALRAKVKRKLFQLALTQRLKEIYLETKNVVKSLSETIAGMYASGMVPQQDVFLAQMQIYEIEQKILEQERKERELRADFVDLLGRSIPPDFPVFALPEEIPLPPEAGKMYELALKWSPMIQMARANLESQKSGERLAEKEFKPDAMVMLGYSFRGISLGPVWSAGAQITVPFYKRTKQEKLLEQAQWKVSQSESQLQSTINSVLNQIDALLASIQLLRQQVAYQDEVQAPQAVLTLESSFSAYLSGKVNLMTHLDNLMRIYELKMGRAMKVEMGWEELADLEEMVGMEWEKWGGERK